MTLPKQFYYKKNRLQQVRGFCSVVQEGNMAKAARKMGLTQGAITLQIQSLERDLNIDLFERNNKGSKLSDAGREFYDHAIGSLQNMESLFETFVCTVPKSKPIPISIGSNIAIFHILPKYVKKFQDLHPEVDFKIKYLTKKESIKMVINGELDLAIYSLMPHQIPPEIDFIPIISYPPVLITHKNHPLAKNPKPTMADIKKYELLRLDPSLVTVPNFDEIARQYGLKTKFEFEMVNYEVLKKFVSAGVGISIVSAICLENEADKNLVSKDLSQYFPSITYGVIIKKGVILSGLKRRFVEILKTEKLIEGKK